MKYEIPAGTMQYEIPAGTGLRIDTETRQTTMIEDAVSVEVMNRLQHGYPMHYNGYTVFTHPGTKDMSVLAEAAITVEINPDLDEDQGWINIYKNGYIHTVVLRPKVDIPRP